MRPAPSDISNIADTTAAVAPYRESSGLLSTSAKLAATNDIATTEHVSPADLLMTRRLHRRHAPLSFWIQWLLALASIPFAFLLGGFLLPETALDTSQARTLGVLSGAGMLLTYPVLGIFRRLRSQLWSCIAIVFGWLVVAIEVTLVAKFIGVKFDASSGAVLVFLSSTLALQLAMVFGARGVFFKLRPVLSTQTPVLVVGTGALAGHLITAINRNPYLSDEVVAVISEDEGASPAPEFFATIGSKLSVSGSVADLAEIVGEMQLERVYLALPFARMGKVHEIQAMLQDLNIDVVWAPDVGGLHTLNPAVKEIAGMPLLALSESPLSDIASAYSKSLFDVTIASLMLLVFTPLMLVVAAGIKLTSAGPVFYRQPRHGWDGTVFKIWKFRTMYAHDEDLSHVAQAQKGDARITPLGRVLRRTSMDELPQLLNVLGGTMSLVGPRPHAVSHNLDYAREIETYMARHRIKPGITGLAQIKGFRGETATIELMRQRIKWDLRYINSWSLWQDLWILLRTPMTLFSDRAY